MPSFVEIILQADWWWEGGLNQLQIIIKADKKRLRGSIWWYRLANVLRLRLIQQLARKKLLLITIIRNLASTDKRGEEIATQFI